MNSLYETICQYLIGNIRLLSKSKEKTRAYLLYPVPTYKATPRYGFIKLVLICADFIHFKIS